MHTLWSNTGTAGQRSLFDLTGQSAINILNWAKDFSGGGREGRGLSGRLFFYRGTVLDCGAVGLFIWEGEAKKKKVRFAIWELR